MTASHYIIRGGHDGRERLRLLSRVMRPSTQNLIERTGIRSGMACLDCGCGGGDVTVELAAAVGKQGRVLGIDIDEIVLGLARAEAAARQLDQVEFQQSCITESVLEPHFDAVYSRFLLTHLPDPEGALARMHRALRPGGMLVAEDIEFDGHFSHPESNAFRRYIQLYSEAARRRGADPNIGRRLPALLTNAGFERVQVNVVQPAGMHGDVKLISPLTMEYIAEAVLNEGLIDRSEIDRLIAELYDFAQNPLTLMSVPRVIQAWGYRAS